MKRFYLLALFLIMSLMAGCASNNPTEPMSRTEMLLGTVCSIRLYDKKSNSVMSKAFARIKELEKLVSANDDGTEIDKINLNAGIEPVKVSAETFYLIQKGLEYGKLSRGDFEITIGPLTSLWHIGFDDARIPAQFEIDEQLKHINFGNVEMDADAQTVFLKNKNMKLDLGAIAKGYIADEVVKVLKANGVGSAIVDLGGNIIVLGNKAGVPWKVGIQDPDQRRNEYVGIIECEELSIVTSGIYERFITAPDGQHYHHLLNPADGYPFDNEIAGVSIVSQFSVDGDGLSTTIFAKGLHSGLAAVEQMPNVEAIFITKSGMVYITSGLQDSFELTNNNYKMGN